MHLFTLFNVFTLFTVVVFDNVIHEQKISGIWQNEAKELVIRVEPLDDGIKVKRQDQSIWYYYDQIRPNQYRDDLGNTYYLLNDQSLEWESSDGIKRIVFNRSDNKAAQTNKSGDTYIEKNHFFANAEDKYIAVNDLLGSWLNESTGQKIWITRTANEIEVQANNSSIRFRRTDGNTFRDSKGNRYDYVNGRLAYVSQSGDFYMRFKKE